MPEPPTDGQRPAFGFQPYKPPPVLPKRRPGAPRGNMNALKGGKSSKQFRLLAAVLRAHPEFAGNDLAQEMVARLIPEVVRADAAGHKAAVARARAILAPYQPERYTERITQRLIMAVIKDQEERS